MYLFNGFKLITNLLEPSGLLTKKMFEMNCPLQGLTFLIALMDNNFEMA